MTLPTICKDCGHREHGRKCSVGDDNHSCKCPSWFYRVAIRDAHALCFRAGQHACRWGEGLTPVLAILAGILSATIVGVASRGLDRFPRAGLTLLGFICWPVVLPLAAFFCATWVLSHIFPSKSEA